MTTTTKKTNYFSIKEDMEWRELSKRVDGLSSYYKYTEYLKENHGFKYVPLAGKVGDQGGKIHRIVALLRETEEGFEVALARVYCGSH